MLHVCGNGGVEECNLLVRKASVEEDDKGILAFEDVGYGGDIEVVFDEFDRDFVGVSVDAVLSSEGVEEGGGFRAIAG